MALVSLALTWFLGVALAQDACFPDCREGYLCHEGACISACNPPCDDGERCTDEGECVAKERAVVAEPPRSAPSAMGRVCVFRDRNAGGFAIRVGIREGGALITSLKPGTFHCWDTSAGPHAYTAKTEVEKLWEVVVPEGDTLYLRARIVMGAMVGRPDLAASDKAEFEDTNKPWEPANEL